MTIFQQIPIVELCERVTSGATPLRSRRDYYDGGTIDWFKTGELKDGFLLRSQEHITQKALQETSVKLFPRNTVLMAMYGDGKTITSLGMLKSSAASNQACVAMIVDERRCHFRYLFYALKLKRSLLVKLAYGGAQRNLTSKLIKEFELPVPPLETQRRIAGILSAYDDLIENNTRRIAILEEMARLIYREWFVNFRFPSHENVKFVDSELGKIPEGWEVKNFPDFVDVLSGGTPKTEEPLFWNGDIPFFTPRDAPESVYVLSTLKNVTQLGVTRCNSKLYPPDTLFITARGTVGKLALAGSEMIMSQSCYALRGKAGIGQSFLYLLTGTCIDQLQKSAHGSVFDTIIVDTFNLLRSALPPISLIAQFEEVASPLFELIKTLLRSNVNLRKTRDLLLPRLISGEIDVSDLNIETPMETEHQTIDLPKQGTATTPVMQPGMVEQKVQEMEERAEAFIIAPAAGPVEEGAVLIHSEVEESAAAETKGRTSTNSTIPIEEIETNTVMAAMRSVAKQTGPTTRDEFLRATCRELGYGRIGSKIEEALRGHLRAAFRRGILATERDEVWLATPSFSDYTVDKLVDEIKGSMLAKGEYEREDVTRNVANNLGFRRVTDSVRETMKSAFNAAIRRGVLGRKGSVIWREE
jgi:type I restriction enzyme S subunit